MQIVVEIGKRANLRSHLLCYLTMIGNNFVERMFLKIFARNMIHILAKREALQAIHFYISMQFGILLFQSHHWRTSKYNMKLWEIIITIAQLFTPIWIFIHLIKQKSITTKFAKVVGKVDYGVRREVEVVKIYIQAPLRLTYCLGIIE